MFLALALVIFVFLLICVYKGTLFKRPYKSLLGFDGNKSSNVIVFVIIHNKELHDGGLFWLNLILKKKVV